LRKPKASTSFDGVIASGGAVPEVLPRLFNDPGAAAASRARAAMMQVKKIDIAALEAAFHQHEGDWTWLTSTAS
jgi:hypothetical protein